MLGGGVRVLGWVVLVGVVVRGVVGGMGVL